MIGFFHRTIPTVHAAALILGAAGFLSKLLGLLRDRLLAGHFGASRELDVYYAAFQIPDVVYSVLLLGAGSMAILPLFTEMLEKSREDAERFMQSLVTFFSIVASGAILIGIIAAPFLIAHMFPGFGEAAREQAIFLTRVIFISPLFLGISGILSSSVQVYRRFFAYASAAILYNVGIIIGILVFVPVWGVRGLAFGVLLGACMHAASQYASYRHIGFRLRFVRSWWNEGVRKVLSLSFPRVIAMSLTQATLVVLMGIASTLHAGSLAIFQFANNLGFLPVGIFAISYATALFPRLAENALARNGSAFFENIFFGIRTVALWIIPLAFLFVVLRAHIVRVVLGTGAFSWADTRLTAAAFAVLSLALIGESMNGFFIRGFYAMKQTWTPLFINACSMAVAVAGGFFFTYVFISFPAFANGIYALFRIENVPGGEVLGVVFGFSLGIICNTFLLSAILFSSARRAFDVSSVGVYVRLVRPLIYIGCAACMSALVAYGVLSFLSPYILLQTFVRVLIDGGLAGMAGCGAYIAILWSFRQEDFMGIVGSFRKRFFRIGSLPKNWNGEKQHLEQ